MCGFADQHNARVADEIEQRRKPSAVGLNQHAA
jgi:hypothetical protein